MNIHLYLKIHGDAAFTGQGVNQETLMLTQVPHFEVGGSLHVVVNNQVITVIYNLSVTNCKIVKVLDCSKNINLIKLQNQTQYQLVIRIYNL